MSTIKEEIAKLETEHWNSLIALASKAENADDLNAVLDRLDKLYESTHGHLSLSGDAFGTVLDNIEKAVTQWQDITIGFDETEWKMPIVWGIEGGRIFRKDDDTVILYDEMAGEYIECNRCDQIAEVI